MKQVTRERVGITGIGVITPFAVGWEEAFCLSHQATPAYAPWSAENGAPFDGARLGLISRYPKERYFDERQMRLMDRAMTISTVAAGFAMEDAGLLVNGEVSAPDEVATIVATSRGEMPSLYRFGSPLFRPGGGSVNPAHFPMIARNIACGQIAIRFGLRGWSTMIASGDASGSHALMRACELIALGRASSVIVGAYEVFSQISLHSIKARWRKHGVQAAIERSADNDHVPVEGACFFVLESERRAAKRGRRLYASIEHATQGYRADASLRGCQSVLARHFSKSGVSSAAGSIHVSGAPSSENAGCTTWEAQREWSADVTARAGCQREILTRALFGDAGAVTAMYQVATAAQCVQDGAAPTAIISALTDRGACSLLSLRAQ